MPIPPVLLALGVGLLLVAASEPKKKRTQPLPDEELYEVVNGQTQLTPIARKQTIDSMLFRVLAPTQAHNIAMAIAGDGTKVFGPEQSGAYWQLLGLHNQGYDLWIYPLQPKGIVGPEHPIAFVLPGQPAPDGMALMLAASQPWPAPPPGVTMPQAA